MPLTSAGVSDGRQATTHWNSCELLIRRAPGAHVDPDPIFVRDKNIYTSAGVTAGMDLALALVEEDHGSRLALQVARNLVLYLRRPGGQSQFSAALSLQLTDRKPLRELESWVLDNLNKPLTVPVLAQRVAMSPRNFARVFGKEMKTTPAKFVERLRVEVARRRLEESQNSMETIASECGFGNVNSMRNVFQRTLKIPPGHYRRHYRSMRDGDWKCAPIPSDIQDRRVEITGPTDRKMVINALNSGAKIFMADFEDANAPTWRNMVEGQINLRDAIRGTINFTNPEGKEYKLNEQVAVLMPRPRGWHLVEKHVLIDGEPVAGGFFDFGLFFYHNAQELIARGSGPYFYLPKMESHREARIWNDVFQLAQKELGIPYGTIRATVLIETIPAAFEMDEIQYELRDHSC